MFNTTSETTRSNRPSIIWLVLVLIAGGLYVAGQYVASGPQRIAQETEAKREISVQGKGEKHAAPDIALINLGVQTGTQTSALAATQLLSKRFTDVTAALKQLGIADKDIKATNLSLQPVYNYQSGSQSLLGFQASESVAVKVRNLDKVSDVIGRTTMEGVNNIGGITFSIDDPDALKQEAQALAIADARGKAQVLAKSLGVSLGQVKSFTASDESPQPVPMYANALSSDSAEKVSGPPVPAGEQDINSNVTITYEIK